MWKPVIFLSIIILYLMSAAAYNCYPEFCHKKESLDAGFTNQSSAKCLLTGVKNDEKCRNLEFHKLKHLPPNGIPLSSVKLTAYAAILPEYYIAVTAFNLTVQDMNFKRLVTRYQELGNPSSSYCRYIQLLGAEDSELLPEFYISCPFSNISFERSQYTLEYLIAGNNYEYSRKLVFKVPNHTLLNAQKVENYVPFFYIDVSDMNSLILYIQPAPEQFNITKYHVWLINYDTNNTISKELSLFDQNTQIQSNFSVTEGLYYFVVSAIHPNCGYYCKNATSPAISTKHPARRILIMIISVVWIPPVILYAIYYLYKLYKKKVMLKIGSRKPNCLLVYSPTHLAHVNVMLNFVKYLKNCNINAMIDILDIPKTEMKDPCLWCLSTFKNADVIIVVTSPFCVDNTPVIYRNMDNYLLKLIKENYLRGNKRYIAVEFPYCKPDDMPEEAEMFKRFSLPKNLDKIIKFIHNNKHHNLFNTSGKELVDSIEIAVKEVPQHRSNSPQSNKEGDDLSSTNLIPSDVKINDEIFYQTDKQLETNYDVNKQCKRNFTTKISDLNLLGEDLQTDKQVNKYLSLTSNSEFHVDQLDL